MNDEYPTDEQGDDSDDPFDGKPIVHLWSIGDGCGLVVPHPTGVIMHQQIAGMRCFQKYEEGFFLPVDWGATWTAARLVFREYDHGDRLDSLPNLESIDEALAADTDGKVRLDRSKLQQSYEAWVWLEGDFSRWIDNLAVKEAAFTWQNCD